MSKYCFYPDVDSEVMIVDYDQFSVDYSGFEKKDNLLIYRKEIEYFDSLKKPYFSGKAGEYIQYDKDYNIIFNLGGSPEKECFIYNTKENNYCIEIKGVYSEVSKILHFGDISFVIGDSIFVYFKDKKFLEDRNSYFFLGKLYSVGYLSSLLSYFF